ncbi:carboxymuconolactone decarboxylase family protein [Comamonas humi]
MTLDRLPPIPEDQWTGEQRRSAQEVIHGPRGALISPFVPLLRSPELMDHAQRMGEYLRYRSTIGQRLSELAILLVARQWTQQVEWAIHVPIALREGVSRDIIEAIAQGVWPADMRDDESLLYEFCMQLQRKQAVSDDLWQQAVQCFGEQGVVDLIGITGYYTFLAMVMNVACTAVPDTSVAALLPLPPG